MILQTLQDTAVSEIRSRAQRDREFRAELGRRLCDMIDAGEVAKSKLRKRWERNLSLYRNQTIRADNWPYEGAPNIHAPLVQPKINILVSSVAQVVTAQKPYFSVSDYADASETLHHIEKALQFFLEKSNFDTALRKATQIAAICGVAIIRVDFTTTRRDFLPMVRHQSGGTMDDATVMSGLQFDVIHPENFTVFPAGIEEIPEAKLVGHRFNRRRQEVRELAQAGEYFDMDEEELLGLASSNEDIHESLDERNVKAHTPTDEAWDEQLELWQVIFKSDLNEDGFEELYIATVAKDSQALLDIENYHLPEPWYFALRFHVEFGSFWPDGSIAHQLQGLQIEYNELHNVFLLGAYTSALPAGFGDIGGAPESEMAYRPGAIYPVTGGQGVQFAAPRWNGTAMLEMIRQVEAMADRITRVTDVAVPRQVPGEQTATEVLHQNQQLTAGIMEYTGIFAGGLESVARFALTLIGVHESVWKGVYGEQLGLQGLEAEVFYRPSSVALAGKSSTASPAARITAINAILQTSMNTPVPQMLNWPEVARTIVLNSGLPHASKLVMTEEESAAILAQQAQMEQEAIGADLAVKHADAVHKLSQAGVAAGVGLGGVPGEPGMEVPEGEVPEGA